MLQIENKLALAQAIGSLPMTILFVILSLSLGYIFYNLYKNSKEKTLETLETILDTNKKILTSNLEIVKKIESNIIEMKTDRKIFENHLKDHTNKITQEVEKTSTTIQKVLSYKFTGKGIKSE